jgi:uncharacterized protein with PIN domain
MICVRCEEELVPKKINMEYLGHRVSTTLPVCPKCGNLFIPESLIREKMRALEETLEDK